MFTIAAIALVLLSAILSVAFPLATYTLTLATFGLTHVLTELHYVENRFSQRLINRLRVSISQLLLIIISLRSLQVFGLIPTWVSIPLELSCVVGLIILVIPILVKKDWRLGILATVLVAGIALGILYSPTLTLLLFAVLHNLTPVGFIAEKLRGSNRDRALLACAIVFILIPLLILSGIPYKLLSSLNLVEWEFSLLPVGGIEAHLGVFVPKQLHNQIIAIHAFSAAVFLQSMHYAIVIGVLPTWEDSQQSRSNNSIFIRYPLKQFTWFIILFSTLLFIGFTIAFKNARAVYGIIAAVHAWVEIPILLLALAIPDTSEAVN